VQRSKAWRRVPTEGCQQGKAPSHHVKGAERKDAMLVLLQPTPSALGLLMPQRALICAKYHLIRLKEQRGRI